MEKENKVKRKVIECHPELIDILDKLEAPIREFTWDIVKVGYFEKTAILARKINGKIPK